MDALRGVKSAKKSQMASNMQRTIPNICTGLRDIHLETNFKAKAFDLNDDEKKTIIKLKKLYMETILLDVELQQEIYNLEKSFEKKHLEIFDKRKLILEEVRRKTHGGDGAKQENVVYFWLNVLKASYTEAISKQDEEILKFLIDVRAKFYTDPSVMFIIEFHFLPNDFFSNRLLTKTYYLNFLPEAEDPLSYDGSEVYKCEGCKIDWKANKNPSKNAKPKKEYSSFFDFFNPPVLPDDPEDSSFYDINAVLQNDFELGFYMKERVIPKAVMFFTGEIAECQSSDSEDEDDEGNEDNDNDDDGDENDDDGNGNDSAANE